VQQRPLGLLVGAIAEVARAEGRGARDAERGDQLSA